MADLIIFTDQLAFKEQVEAYLRRRYPELGYHFRALPTDDSSELLLAGDYAVFFAPSGDKPLRQALAALDDSAQARCLVVMPSSPSMLDWRRYSKCRLTTIPYLFISLAALIEDFC